MQMQFEFHVYSGGDDGTPSSLPEIHVHSFSSDRAARSAAGRYAKRANCPVDLARAGGAEWSERYLSTAIPSEQHASGYRLERLT